MGHCSRKRRPRPGWGQIGEDPLPAVTSSVCLERRRWSAVGASVVTWFRAPVRSQAAGTCVPGTILGAFHISSQWRCYRSWSTLQTLGLRLVPLANLLHSHYLIQSSQKHYRMDFIDAEREALHGSVTCPRSQGWREAGRAASPEHLPFLLLPPVFCPGSLPGNSGTCCYSTGVIETHQPSPSACSSPLFCPIKKQAWRGTLLCAI